MGRNSSSERSGSTHYPYLFAKVRRNSPSMRLATKWKRPPRVSKHPRWPFEGPEVSVIYMRSGIDAAPSVTVIRSLCAVDIRGTDLSLARRSCRSRLPGRARRTRWPRWPRWPGRTCGTRWTGRTGVPRFANATISVVRGTADIRTAVLVFAADLRESATLLFRCGRSDTGYGKSAAERDGSKLLECLPASRSVRERFR